MATTSPAANVASAIRAALRGPQALLHVGGAVVLGLRRRLDVQLLLQGAAAGPGERLLELADRLRRAAGDRGRQLQGARQHLPPHVRPAGRCGL